MRWLFKTWRVGVGIMFLVAALGKIVAPTQLLSVLLWDGFPPALAQGLLALLIGVEIAIAILLLFTDWLTPAWGAIGLLAVFTVQLVLLHRHQDAPLCSCFGVFSQVINASTQTSAAGIVRNLAIVMSGAALVWFGTTGGAWFEA